MSKYLTSALVVATFVSLLAGTIAGVLATLWLVPRVVVSEPRTAGTLVALPGGAATPDMLAQAVESTVFALVTPKAFRPLGPGTFVAPDAVQGRAVMVTSDGWIVFDSTAAVTGLVALSGGGDTAVIRKIFSDPGTGLDFAKLEGLPPMPSLPFAYGTAVENGEPLYAVLGRDAAVPVVVLSHRVAPARPEDAVVASETFSRRILIGPALGKAARGTPVFDRGGSLFGIVTGERGDQVIPFAYARPAFTALARTGVFRRPYIGVRGIPLADLAGLESGRSRRGVYVVSVQPGSPAALSGLVAGDVILEIEGDALSPGEQLAESLRDYRPGEEIAIRFRRGTTERDSTAVLGDTGEVR